MIACPIRKFYPGDYSPVCRCCVPSIVAMPGDVCVVCGNSRAKDRSVSMHRFPRGHTRRKQWLKALKIDENNVKDHHRVCSRHFPNADASNTPDLTLGKHFASPKTAWISRAKSACVKLEISCCFFHEGTGLIP